MTKTNLTVANTILEQLGGRRFIAMTGAKNIMGSDDGLQFRIGQNAMGVTNVKVTLDESDTYVVDFFKIRGLTIRNLARVCGVYADGLRQTFEIQTGLLTSL